MNKIIPDSFKRNEEHKLDVYWRLRILIFVMVVTWTRTKGLEIKNNREVSDVFGRLNWYTENPPGFCMRKVLNK